MITKYLENGFDYCGFVPYMLVSVFYKLVEVHTHFGLN